MITFEDIKKANECIRTTDIKGKNYAEVNQRVKAFRMVYPNGTIETIRDYLDGEIGERIVGFTANIYDDNHNLLASGTAEEKENSTFINKTSFIENAETSSVGRALGFCGYGIDVSIASADEVQNAIANQNKSEEIEKPKKISEELWKSLKEHFSKEDIQELMKQYGVEKGKDLPDAPIRELVMNHIKAEQEPQKEFY